MIMVVNDDLPMDMKPHYDENATLQPIDYSY